MTISRDSEPKVDERFKRFLSYLPEDVAGSLTKQHLQGICAALQATQWRRHTVDIRFSVPLPWKPFYIVFLAGPERRSHNRRNAAREQFPIWTPANILLIVGLNILGILFALGLFHLKAGSLNFFQPTQIHPTEIPFKHDKATCEQSGRLWEEDSCIDSTHSPTF